MMFRIQLSTVVLIILLSALTTAQGNRDNKSCSSLHECAEVGDAKRLDELLRRTTTIDVANDYGETPLFTAVRYENPDAATLLISAGANVNAPNKDRTTPLMMAVLGQNVALITALLKAGADVNATDNDGVTVLMHGTMFVLPQTTDILRLLVSRGANVNVAAIDGRTALMFAVHGTVITDVKCLLSLGANVKAKDNKGLTALDHVNDMWSTPPVNNYARKLQREMRKVLIAAGASH